MKNNWQTKKLGEIGKIFSGNSINAKTKKDKYLGLEEGIPYVATKDISYKNEIDYGNGVKIPERELDNFKIAHKNSVFICAEGGSAGRKLAFNVRDVCFVNKLFTFEANEFIESKFVYYFYQSGDFQKQFKSRITGLIGGVSLNKFKDIEINYPSLKEQKQIVKILDEVFESISKSKENAEKNLKNTKELFESYLEEIFTNPKEDWEEKKLGDVCEIERGGSPRPIKSFLTNSKEGVNWIKIGDTKNVDKYIYETREKIKPEGIKRSRLVKEGDFILSNSMSFGRPYIMKTTGCIHDGWLVLRENANILNKDFLYYLLGSKFMYYQFNLSAVGSTVRNLNINLVKKIIIPIPTLSEQTQIISKLDALSKEIKELEIIYKQKIKDIEELKKSMLQKAFSGELTKE